MKRLFRMVTVLGLILTSFLALSGCGKDSSWEQWSTGQMAVDKDGKIIYCVVDEFDKNYYDVEELSKMAGAEAADFNGKNKAGETDPVTVLDVSKLEADQGKVRVVYQFDKDASYAKFQNETLFFETLEQAVSQKHVFTGSVLYDGEGGSIALDETNKAKYKDKHVLITDEKTVITLPYDVLFYGYGVKVLKDGRIDTTECEDTAVVIMKK